ncbi:MAG: MATE family efflux transporter [Bdellovibrio bacteriovorus]
MSTGPDTRPDPLPALPPALPALAHDALGRRRIDYRAVVALAAPLFVNAGVQAVLNLTDTWFLGRISPDAIAAVGAIYWFVILFVLVLGGVGIAVQTLVAQAYGAGNRYGASEVAWGGLWVTVLMTPLFLLAGLSGGWLLSPFELDPNVESLALAYWFPRMSGAVAGVGLWVITSFFNGIGSTRVTLGLNLCVALLNAWLNQVIAFDLGFGMAGIAWATTASQALVLVLALALFLSRPIRRDFGSHHYWRPRGVSMGRVLALGMPAGATAAADLGGTALFQLMQVDLGTVPGAATQIVMMLTSMAYMPAIGIASAGTTLVGQAIGAGDRDWAYALGNAVIRLVVAYMGLLSLVLALGGPWLIPLFVSTGDPQAAAVVQTGALIIWIASAYQVFDGVHFGAGFALRGAGDVRIPALMVNALAWLGFVPLSHMLSFAPGEGWVDFLPQLGLGTLGGWAALLIYAGALGALIWLRWRSGAWRRIALQ